MVRVSVWQGPSAASPSGAWSDSANWLDGIAPQPASQYDNNTSAAVLPDLTRDVSGVAVAVPYAVALNKLFLNTITSYDLTSLALGSATVVTAPGAFDVELDIDGGPAGAPVSTFVNATVVTGADGGVVLTRGASLGVGAPSYDPAQGPAFDPAVTRFNGVRFGDATASILYLLGTGPVADVGGPRRTVFTHPDDFQTPILGFGGRNLIDLGVDFGYYEATSGGTVGFSYAPGYQGGVLTVALTPPQGAPAGAQPLLMARLNLVGDYESSNFTLVDNSALLAIGFALNDVTSTGDRRVVQGTGFSDLITASGSLDRIFSNGGNDTIRTTGNYDTVVVGFLGDELTSPEFLPSTLTDTIELGGRGNTVVVGDENTAITGSLGYDSISLGHGRNTVVAGAYSTLRGDGGTYDVTVLDGHAAITLRSESLIGSTPYPPAGPWRVTLGGTSNVVMALAGSLHSSFSLVLSGGGGSSEFDVAGGGDVTIVPGGLYNRFTLDGRKLDVTTGSGYATVDLSNGDFGTDATIRLGGTHNIVRGQAYTIDVSGGTGSNSVLLGDNVVEGFNVTVGGLYNAVTVANTAHGSVNAGSGYDRVGIVSAPGSQGASPQAINVQLAGLGNSVNAAGAQVVVQGGTGSGTFAFDRSDVTLTTGGSRNAVTLSGSHGTVDPGSDHATVALTGGDARLLLHGAGNAVFLNVGASGTIAGGASPDLRVTVASGIGAEVIQGLLADTHALLTLAGGAGGYTNTAQVIAALQPDGAGGTRLAVGTGSLNFAGVGSGDLHAGMFAIRG